LHSGNLIPSLRNCNEEGFCSVNSEEDADRRTASLIADTTIDNIEYKKALLHASSEYILALEEIHETFLQKKGNGTY